MAIGECIALESDLSVTTECTGDSFVYKYYKSEDCTGTVVDEKGVSSEFGGGGDEFTDECLRMEQCGDNAWTTVEPTMEPTVSYPFIAEPCAGVYVVDDIGLFPVGTVFALGECFMKETVVRFEGDVPTPQSSKWSCIDGLATHYMYEDHNCEGTPFDSAPMGSFGAFYGFGDAQVFCESERTCDIATFTMAEGSTMEGCEGYELGGHNNLKLNMAIGECIALESDLSVTTECTGDSFVYKYYKSEDCTGTVVDEKGVSSEFGGGGDEFTDECLRMEQCGDNAWTTVEPTMEPTVSYPFIAEPCAGVYVVDDIGLFPVGTVFALGECFMKETVVRFEGDVPTPQSSKWSCIDGLATHYMYEDHNCEGTPFDSAPMGSFGAFYGFGDAQVFCESERTCDIATFTMAEGSTMEGCESYALGNDKNLKMNMAVGECIVLESALSVTTECTGEELVYIYFESDDCTGTVVDEKGVSSVFTGAKINFGGEDEFKDECLRMEQCGDSAWTTTTAAPIPTVSYPFIAEPCAAVYIVDTVPFPFFPVGTVHPLGECVMKETYEVVVGGGPSGASYAWNCVELFPGFWLSYYDEWDNINCEGDYTNRVQVNDFGDAVDVFCHQPTCDIATFTLAKGSSDAGCGSSDLGGDNLKMKMAVGECIAMDATHSVTTECTGDSFVYKWFQSDDCTGTVISESSVSSEFQKNGDAFNDECLMMEQCAGNADDALTAGSAPVALDSLLNGAIAGKEQPTNDATWTEILDNLEAHGGLLTVMALLVLGVFCVCCVGCAWFMHKAGTGYGPVKQAYIDEVRV